MKNFPHLGKNASKTDRLQSQLLAVAGIILFAYATILTLSPMVRFHGEADGYPWKHWFGVIAWVAAFSLLHYQSARKLPGRDPNILPVVGLLTGIGLMTIWRLYPNMGFRQTLWILIASSVVFLGLTYPVFLNYLRRYKYIWLLAGLFLTGLTIFIGTNPGGNGPRLWLGFLGIHFQPSEFLKLLLIAYLASFFTDRLVLVYRKLNILLPTLFVIGSALILLVVQRDLGTAIIFLLIYLGMVFSTKGSKIVIIAALILFSAGVFLSYHYFDIVRLRVDAWLNPFGDPSGASYQILQSIIAIAEGGMIGSGPGLGSPTLVPVSVSDFVFSAILEELGFMGGILVISLFIIFIYRGIKIISHTPHSFDRYFSLGLIFYFGIQSALIIGGNIGLLPLTGVTLPFVSYGGSSLVTSFLAMLFLLIMSDRAKTESQPVIQRRLIRICSVLIVLLVLEIFVISLASFWFMPSLVNRPENPRWIIDDRFSERGKILDRDNQIIITNTGTIGYFQRESNHIPLYPIVGYTNATYGQTGIENAMYPYLRGLEGYPNLETFWHNVRFNQPPEGLDVRLTIDLDAQKLADELLAQEPGAVVMMNAQSGEIIAMASHPYFDAKNLEEDWENLVNDADAPLINRASQGLYPPGATLFPYIGTLQVDLFQQIDQSISIIEESLQMSTCAKFPGVEPTWQSVMTNGCQSVQVVLAEKVGLDRLLDLFQNLNFFSPPDLRIDVAPADSPDLNPPDELYSGGGAFNVSPLQMALAASALTNQGILPAPKIVNAYQNPQGEWITLSKVSQNTQALDENAVLTISNLMKSPDSSHWQTTAVVESQESQDITWFVAGTSSDWQGQPTVVVVVLERKSPAYAENIGVTLLEESIHLSSLDN